MMAADERPEPCADNEVIEDGRIDLQVTKDVFHDWLDEEEDEDEDKDQQQEAARE